MTKNERKKTLSNNQLTKSYLEQTITAISNFEQINNNNEQSTK